MAEFWTPDRHDALADLGERLLAERRWAIIELSGQRIGEATLGVWCSTCNLPSAEITDLAVLAKRQGYQSYECDPVVNLVTLWGCRGCQTVFQLPDSPTLRKRESRLRLMFGHWRRARSRKRKFRRLARDVGLTISLCYEFDEYGGREYLKVTPTEPWTGDQYELASHVMRVTFDDCSTESVLVSGGND